MQILIIKHGALGDVVRTSYFAAALRRRHGKALTLTWITAPSARPLLQFNPHVDRLVTDFAECRGTRFDHVYSLDDEVEVVRAASALDYRAITGAFLDPAGQRVYTDDAREWFDMGLLSRFGKDRADEIKRTNTRSHGQIFSAMFGVDEVTPTFHGDPDLASWARTWRGSAAPMIGINPFAGGRWPAKELLPQELDALVSALLDGPDGVGPKGRLVLLGAGADHDKNRALADRMRADRILVPNTDDSVLRLAAIIGALDYLITSDSLAMHLAIGQRIPFLAFFSPTSAAEIDTFGFGVHVVSTASDYCSYRKDADNRSITAARLLEAMRGQRSPRAAASGAA